MGSEIIDAPTNLGLRPPAPDRAPGAVRSPAALRAAGLHARLTAAGMATGPAVVARPYEAQPRTGESVLNLDALLEHADRLAAAVGATLDRGERAVVLGGDCSVLVGIGLALKRGGRFGLVHLDGHTDFRHPGNADHYGFIAGEDLAVAVGRHRDDLTDRHGLGPYVAAGDIVQIGCRDDDEHLDEVRATVADVVTARFWLADPDAALNRVRHVMDRAELDGYWVHLDVDVLDPAHVTAVDSPTPGGADPAAVVTLLQALFPDSSGLSVCCFDPDLDTDRSQAALISDLLVAGTTFESDPRHARTGV